MTFPGDCHVIMGLWPIAGITTIGVTAKEADATVAAAIDAGVTAFDTAFSYGFQGQSDHRLGNRIRGQRDRFFVIGKIGQRWNDRFERVIDGRAVTLIADAENSLNRIGIDRFDLLMLHSPDPDVPIEDSAEGIASLRERDLCSATGICNADPEQIRRFAEVVKCDAIQCPLNLMQRDRLGDVIPSCESDGREVFVFWTLMKGLLAGKIGRDHRFEAGDVRPQYEIFQGDARERTHVVLDQLAEIARQSDRTIAQLSIGWALAQSGVTAALVGARHPAQIIEAAAATPLPVELAERIDRIVKRSL